MGERPDIGKMIDEELAKGGVPEQARPLDVKGGAIVESASAAEPEADKGAKRDLWAKERKAHADALTQLHAERKSNPPEKRDALTGAELEEIRGLIAQAAKEDDKISTAVLKEGIAVADESTLHPYDKGLESITDKLLSPGTELYRQAVMLLNSQPDGKTAMEALMRKIPERMAQTAKATEQKKMLAGGSERPKPMTAEAAPPAKAAEPPAADKRKAVQEAMQPFYEDVNRMLEGDKKRKEREARESKAANEDKEKKPGFWDKLFGKKAA